MYLVKTPGLIKTIFSSFIWSVPTSASTVFLTFDDGPIPEVTPWVLDLLLEYNMKATFFCVGDNANKYPELLKRITKEGHSIGNHTYHHLNGWKTEHDNYINDLSLCSGYIESTFFRPPYGKLTLSQAKSILATHEVIMWDLLSGDFDQTISSQRCLQNVLDHYAKGAIIVFHDSLKAEKHLKYVLPQFLEHLKTRGFTSQNLSCINPVES